MRGRIVWFCMLCLVLALAAPPVRAAQGRTGSIRVAAGSMTLYRVGDGAGTLSPEFENSGADLADWADPDTARHLAAYARDNAIPGDTRAADETGTVFFPALQTGVYLLTQSEHGSVSPFLVPIPLTLGEDVYYDIEAAPKAAPYHPDTGQPLGAAHWLAVSSAALLGLTALTRGRKKLRFFDSFRNPT